MEESLHVVNTFEHDMTCLDIFMDQTRIVLSIGVQSTSFTKHGNEGVHHAPEMIMCALAASRGSLSKSVSTRETGFNLANGTVVSHAL